MARRKTYPGSLEKRAGSWRWRVCINGMRHTETLKGLTHKEAGEYATERFKQLKKRLNSGSQIGMHVSELLDDFQETQIPKLTKGSQAGYKNEIAAARLYFVKCPRGDPRIGAITTADIEGFLDWREFHSPDGQKRDTALASSSREKCRAVIGRVFNRAEKLKLRDGNPVRGTEPSKGDSRNPVILTDAQYEALLAACSEHDEFLRLYALVLGETGARCESEALWLRWEDVDLEGGFLKIHSGRAGHRTKSGKSRWVPLNPRLRAAFREHAARYRMQTYQGERSPWIFHHTIARNGVKAGARLNCLRGSFMHAARKAKVPEGFVQHDLRHRRVTTWLGAGKSPALVKEAMGHANMKTTLGYAHLTREHLRGLLDEEAEAKARLRDLGS